MTSKKIIIAGGTGFIGQELAKFFGKENDVVILGRESGDRHKNAYNTKPVTAENGYRVRYIKWDGNTIEAHWLTELDGADMVINLAGKSVNCRYHEKQKKEIIDSRVHATRVIGAAIRLCTTPPELWINAASTTIYRNEYEKPNGEEQGIISDWKKDNMPYSFLDRVREKKNRFITRLRYGKSSGPYKNIDLDFSVQVCKAWEKAVEEEITTATRKIILRTAITLGEGGVITPFINLCKFALGGKQGNGNQLFSWIHAGDLCRMIAWLYENKEAAGIYNAAAPNAISNEALMKTIRSITGHKIGLPAPTLLLELGSFLIGTETELILKSRWVVPVRALKEGFRFQYETAGKAIEEIVGRLPRRAYHLF